MPPYTTSTLTLPSTIQIFYRHAGSPDLPTLLLLHGFPASSHQFRNLIPLLSPYFHVIAPDLPGYGFTTIPENLDFKYTFTNLTNTIDEFLSALSIEKFALYIFDYGAPVGLRLALKHPDAVTALVTQNGNAYEEGLGKDFWAPVRAYWAASSDAAPALREELRNKFLGLEATKWQYVAGSPDPDGVQPEAYHLDQALLDRPGNKDIQLDLLYDYQSNVALYPAFQKWLRESKVPVLAMWGEKDVIFVPEGAEAFKMDVEKDRLEVRLVDGGHFAVEGKEEVFAEAIKGFLRRFLS
ncbi:MAG: hypothetical protein L6R41_008027 [Letrouitia leprolyta]|nr:MAG: hypothetical protein L6R41_008027 [Letrouitia leprolyta]